MSFTSLAFVSLAFANHTSDFNIINDLSLVITHNTCNNQSSYASTFTNILLAVLTANRLAFVFGLAIANIICSSKKKPKIYKSNLFLFIANY